MATKKKLDKKDHAGMATAAKVVKGAITTVIGTLAATVVVPLLKDFCMSKFTKKS